MSGRDKANSWVPAPFEIAAITQAFRDIADQGYLAARMLHRYGLDLQFSWAALQALEKYFKAILLYNGRSAQRFGHQLDALYDAVCAIPDIAFEYPDDTRSFVRYLQIYGQNRYLQHCHFAEGEELLILDRIVWHVRRYCQYLRRTIRRNGQEVSLLGFQFAANPQPPVSTAPTSV